MNKKVMAALMTGAMVLTATSCSSSPTANETYSTTVPQKNTRDVSAAAGDTSEEWEYCEETTAYYEDFNTEEYNTIKATLLKAQEQEEIMPILIEILKGCKIEIAS